MTLKIRHHEMILREEKINEKVMDWVHVGLDIAGLIPGFGEPFDMANALLYAREGDWLNATLSIVSVIPEVGDFFGKGGKIAIFLEKMISKGGKAGKVAEKILTHVPKVAETVEKGFHLYKDNKTIINKFLDKVKESDDPKIKEYIAPNVSKIQNALKTVERSFDIITKSKNKSSATSAQDKTPITREEIKQSFNDTEREIRQEQILRSMIRNQVKIQILEQRKYKLH